MVRTLFLIFVFIVGSPAFAAEDGISIEQAYGTLSVERNIFDMEKSRAGQEDARYLGELFFVTDLIVRIRVQTLGEFNRDNPSAVAAYNAEIEQLLQAFEHVKTPKHLEYVEIMIIDAIREQQDFFNMWATHAGTPHYDRIKSTLGSEHLVQSSHQKLLQAYHELLELYPREIAANHKSFYSHLCALDFI